MSNAETGHGFEEKWPPDGCTAVGDYAFSGNMTPSLQQVEDAEIYVFTHPDFVDLSEDQRRRNVVRLAMAAGAANSSPAVRAGIEQISLVPLIGGHVVVIKSYLYEGVVVSSYSTDSGTSG